ncbi:hypothetical protein ACNKHQ_02765 [Shigella flexneri]
MDNATRWKEITDAAVEVGPALFISLLILRAVVYPDLHPRRAEGACLVRWRLPKPTPWRGRRRWRSW